MSLRIFESEPNSTDPLEGIDLLYGCVDGSKGKVTDFFRTIALNRGISAQQSYARIGSTLKIPAYVEQYCENLVLKLHQRQRSRKTGAWLLAQDELKACTDYLDILSDFEIAPMASAVESNGSFNVVWFMQPTGKFRHYAAYFLDTLETYQDFCADEGALADLSLRLELMQMADDRDAGLF